MNSIRTKLLTACIISFTACGTGVVKTGTDDTESIGGVSKDTSDIEQALVMLPSARVAARHEDAVPMHVLGDLGTAPVTAAQGDADALSGNLALIAPVFRLRAENLQVSKVEIDELGRTHFKYQQLKNGLPVVGGELSVHLDKSGAIYAAHSTARDGKDVTSTPAISDTEAVARAQAHFADANVSVAAPVLTYEYTTGENELVLAWEIFVQGERAGEPIKEKLYVDAHTGSVVDHRPMIFAALNRKVYSANNGSSLPGTLKRSEGAAAGSDTSVNAAYDNTGATYNFYKTIFGRDSFDNAGGALISTVHYSSNYNNAYWDGTQMVYGDGDGSEFIPLAQSLDVTAHELTHAVTERTANLAYQNESGALNEAMSDIMGNTTEAWAKNGDVPNANTWKVGEDIYTPGTAGDALRYMNNPTADGYSADYYPERLTGSSDNGGVHGNSGIANLAYYLLVQGGHHPRNKTTITVTGIGLDKARRIFYRALTTYFSSNTNFAGALAGTKQAALDLYDATTAANVEAAWNAVGVGTPSGGGGSTGGGTGTVTALQNGVKVTFSGATGSKTYFTFAVPAGASGLKFVMAGGTGDADLYVKFGATPTTSSYDYRPYVTGNNETVTPSASTAGTWYVMVNGYSAFSSTTLTASYTTGGTTPPPSGGNVLQNGVQVNNLSGATGSKVYYTFTVPAGSTAGSIAIGNGTGDADLYVKFGSQPTTTSYDCRPYVTGNNETCNLSAPGTYYVMINGYAAYSGLSILAQAQ